MRNWLTAALGAAEKICLGVSQFMMFAMMVTISIDALGRFLFGKPLQGSYEVTSLYYMVILTFLGMPAMHAIGGHIRIDALRHLLDRVPLRLTERINAALAAAAFSFLAWHTGIDAIEKIVLRETAMGAVQMPLYLSYVWVPVGCGLLTLRLALEIIYPPALTHKVQL